MDRKITVSLAVHARKGITSLLQLSQVSMHSTEQALAYQKEWQVVAVVSAVKRLARVTKSIKYTVWK